LALATILLGTRLKEMAKV